MYPKLDLETIKKINNGVKKVIDNRVKERELRDWQWEIILEDESKAEDWT